MATFLDLFTADDSDGAPASSYQLHYVGSAMSNHDSWIFGMATAVVYALFKAVAVIANGLLGLVMSSASWLDPLSEFYRQITAPLYEVVPPWSIACMGLGIVAFSALWSRPAATTSGLFNSETLDRIGVALALMVIVVVLTQNPFMLITKAMELANGFSMSIAAAATGSGADTTLTAGQALVDNSIRTPTLALNYGAVFNDSCRTAWSTAMLSSKELLATSGCFADGQNRAGPDTLFTALLMLIFPALPMLVFASVAAWKYVLHLSLSVLSMVATAWVAAAAVPRRRGFESLSEQFAHAAGHLVMAVVTSMVAVGLPAMVSGFAANVLGLLNIDDAAGQAFALMLGLGIGFAVAAWAIVKITANTGALVRLLKADANTTLEKTLGVAPAASMTAVFKQFKTWEWARDEEAKAAASKPVPAPRDASKKGTDTMPESTSSADAAAVDALTAPATAIADAAAAQAPLAVDVTVTAGADGASTGAPDADSDGDGFGHFTAAAEETTNGYREGIGADAGINIPGEPTGSDRAGDEIGDSTAFQELTAGTDDVDNAVVVPTSPSDSPPAPAGVATVGSPGVPTPVPGNEFADPALDAVARTVGATFVSTGDPPRPRRPRVRFRRYRDNAPAMDSIPFSTGLVTHGEAVQITDATRASVAAGSDADASVAETEPVTDQQRWNRGLMGRARRVLGRRPVTSRETGAEAPAPAAAIHPGVNRNPASFIAPLPDFLASSAAEAEIEETTTTFAASGHRVQVSLPPQDDRLSLQLSSDPEHRVVRAHGKGFGDPL